MKKIHVVCAAAVSVLLVCLALFTGCRDRLNAETEFSGGDPVGIADLESIRMSLTETEPETAGEYVSWIDGGSSTTYHTHADCPYLSGKKIVSGKRIDAFAACKMDLCSRCAARDGVTPEW